MLDRAEGDLRILENAATFLGFNRPEEAEPLLRRAAAIDPQNGRWRDRIAQALIKRARFADAPDERRRHARAAISELEQGLAFPTEDWVALGYRIDLVKAAVLAEEWAFVEEMAPRVLTDNETCERTFQYGNAIHWANIALGLAAVARGHLPSAADYLVRAGRTPGSPQLDSFGPDHGLAEALLAQGERAAVLTYVEDCARFWKGNEERLAGWRRAVEAGEPRLERCCTEDESGS